MFKIFKKKSDLTGEIFAKQSKIEPVFEHGKIIAFLIFIDDNNSSRKNMKNPSFLKEFMRTIEKRIKDKEYDDGSLYMGDLWTEQKEKDIRKAMRGVMSKTNKPLFQWEV